MTTLDGIFVFFLTWAQMFVYLCGVVVLCKGLYETIQKLSGKLNIISRAGWCVLLIIVPALLCSTVVLACEFIVLPADEIYKIYVNYKTS